MTVKADIRNRALKLLGAIAAGEAASAEDAADVDEIYLSVFDELVQENIAVWGNGTTDEIPEKFVESLARLVAARAAPAFDVPAINGLSPEAVEDRAWMRLRRMIAPDPTSRPLRVDYF